MTSEQKLLLHLLSFQLTGKKLKLPEELKNADIKKTMEEAKHQAVFLLAADAAAAFKDLMPASEYGEEYNAAFALTVKRAAIDLSQQNLVKILEKAGKPYAIIKGTALAKYYKKPELRSFGDVDFLIDPKDVDEISGILENEGYKKTAEDHICHIVFKKPKSHLEMHFEVAGIPNGKQGETVRRIMKNAVWHTADCNLGLGSFKVLNDTENALVMLLHMQHHMLGEGLGLRHIFDLACFVNENSEKPFFSEELLPLLKKIGLLKYTAVMTKTAAVYFNFNCPEFAKNEKDDLCSEIIEDIFTGGNFGRKDRAYNSSLIMVSNHGKDGTKKSKFALVWEVTKNSVKNNHPKASKIKTLYPFLFAYRLLRYSVLAILGKKASISATIKNADKRKKLYSKLNVFESEED